MSLDIYKSVPKIIDFEQAKIEHKRRSGDDVCRHKYVTIDPDNETVECRDCGVSVSPFYALNMLTSYWAEIETKYKARFEEANGINEGRRMLKITQRLDKAWRRKDSIPSCPHCHRGISPDDWSSVGSVSKVYDTAVRRREQVQKRNGA